MRKGGARWGGVSGCENLGRKIDIGQTGTTRTPCALLDERKEVTFRSRSHSTVNIHSCMQKHWTFKKVLDTMIGLKVRLSC